MTWWSAVKGREQQRRLEGDLGDAARDGKVDEVMQLLDSGVNVNADDTRALIDAAEEGHTAIVALLLTRGAHVRAREDRALRAASRYGHTEVVKLLLDYGADIHSKNDAAIVMAAAFGSTKTVALLLNRGGDATVRTEEGRGMNARDAAESKGHPEIVAMIDAHLANRQLAMATERSAPTLLRQRLHAPCAGPRTGRL